MTGIDPSMIDDLTIDVSIDASMIRIIH